MTGVVVNVRSSSDKLAVWTRGVGRAGDHLKERLENNIPKKWVVSTLTAVLNPNQWLHLIVLMFISVQSSLVKLPYSLSWVQLIGTAVQLLPA